jgi:hypothetical protein
MIDRLLRQATRTLSSSIAAGSLGVELDGIPYHDDACGGSNELAGEMYVYSRLLLKSLLLRGYQWGSQYQRARAVLIT